MTKNKFFAVCCIALLSCGIAISMEKVEQSGTSDLLLENVEALSYNEYGYDRGCLGSGDGCTTDWNVWHPTLKGWG